jgi:toxin ParE1/3/4
MPRVVRTPLARRDLKEIGGFLARESQNRVVALRFLDVIAEKCELYATRPELGERCDEFAPRVRRFPVGNYVVFYKPLDSGIQVLRVLHASRDLPIAWRAHQP